jgi:hypothetical protein
MLFRNMNIDNIPEMKKLCNKIKEEYDKAILEENSNIREFIYNYIEGMSLIEKSNVLNSFNIIQLDYYNSNILKKINNKYDGDPLVAICYDLIC